VVNEVHLLKKIRIEIAVTDSFVQKTVKAIIAGAKTNQIGDGKIIILPIDEVIRIRSEEHGEAAVGYPAPGSLERLFRLKMLRNGRTYITSTSATLQKPLKRLGAGG